MTVRSATTARAGRAVAALLVTSLLAGCRAGGDETLTGLGTGPAASAAPTSGPDPASAAAGGTAGGPGATTAPADTMVDPTATTRPLPPTSLDEPARAAAEEQIRAVVQRDWEAWIECSTDPAACDPAATLAEVRTTTGPYYLDDLARLRRWAAEGQVVRQPESRPDENFVITESVRIDPEGTTATARTCTGDGRARYTTAADGRLTLVAGTDVQGYNRAESYLVLEGSAWKIDGFKILEESLLPEGTPLCER